MTATVDRGRPVYAVGDEVAVLEPGIRPWTGTVIAVKPGRSEWRYEVRDAESIVRSVVAAVVERRTR